MPNHKAVLTLIGTYKTLRVVELLEDIVVGTIAGQIEQNVFYKDVYATCREKVKEVTQFLPTQ